MFFLEYFDLFFVTTPLKAPDFKGFYSSRFAIDSNMTAKNQDALLFTAEHLLDLGTDLIIQSAEK